MPPTVMAKAVQPSLLKAQAVVVQEETLVMVDMMRFSLDVRSSGVYAYLMSPMLGIMTWGNKEG
ncbi:hypothetical protein GCM10027031_08940 [Corynebacterium atrinae]